MILETLGEVISMYTLMSKVCVRCSPLWPLEFYSSLKYLKYVSCASTFPSEAVVISCILVRVLKGIKRRVLVNPMPGDEQSSLRLMHDMADTATKSTDLSI